MHKNTRTHAFTGALMMQNHELYRRSNSSSLPVAQRLMLRQTHSLFSWRPPKLQVWEKKNIT